MHYKWNKLKCDSVFSKLIHLPNLLSMCISVDQKYWSKTNKPSNSLLSLQYHSFCLSSAIILSSGNVLATSDLPLIHSGLYLHSYFFSKTQICMYYSPPKKNYLSRSYKGPIFQELYEIQTSSYNSQCSSKSSTSQYWHHLPCSHFPQLNLIPNKMPP